MTHEKIEVRRTEPAAAAMPRWSYSPRIDVLEDEEGFTVVADLPGVRNENVTLDYENGKLRLHGRVEPRQQGVEFLVNEYGIGDFHRELQIGDVIDAEKMTAEMRQGVLTIHLPKTARAKPRRIPVRGG